MNIIEVDSCFNCPFYDHEYMECQAASGLFLDIDVDASTAIKQPPANCPLPVSVVVIKEIKNEL